MAERFGNYLKSIDNREENKRIEDDYGDRIKKYLQKKHKPGYTEQTLLDLIIYKKDKISFLNYLDSQLSIHIEDYSIDDQDQLIALRKDLRELKEEVNNLGPKDFQIIDGNIGNHKFKGKDVFEYIGENFYTVNIDFSKIKNSELGILNFYNHHEKGKSFFIHYDYGYNRIDIYKGIKKGEPKDMVKQLKKKKPFDTIPIDHKFEKVEETIIKGRKKTTIRFRRGAKVETYIEKLGMHLTIKFFEKKLD